MARPAEPRLGVPLRAGRPPTLPETLTSSIAVELTAGASTGGLTNREVWRLAFRSLTFWSRQGCAYQTPVDRAVILGAFLSSDGYVRAVGFRRRIE